ncbi:flagellar hook-associated protein 2 [Thalassobacillus pellis]|uniref:flagellar hook-associated protein 2 n=1 Tax=Thalassobacillus pellis TaxID=748008 RepID=UPI00195FB03B|nr:flagellar hook-associated protein 2 [Thalassobacillus pellis]MBM7551428.1 flagellar hook-associated protein 2 [Thalassobacillus pellis]
MRIGGLASGMDIDKIVKDLMSAERIPLDKMEQDKIWLTWQRDAYRDVNKQLLELDNLTLNMKLEKTYNTKSTTSTQAAAVTATAAASASGGSYSVEVTQLASVAINVSSKVTAAGQNFDPDKAFKDQTGVLANPLETGDFTFYTWNKNGEQLTHTFSVSDTDSLNDVLQRITDADNGVRAFYDSQADKVVLERTETGDFNKGGQEISFDAASAAFFTNTLGMAETLEAGGQNAVFKYNGALTIESYENNYTLNDVTFNFHNTTDGQAKINVTNDIDASVEKITEFVAKYNEIVEKLNDQVSERRNREYRPLTDLQKEAMEEREIELWEEKAKKGMLSGDPIIRGALSEMRSNWYNTVEGAGTYSHLSEIGITTTSNYLDGGKLLIDEDKLRKALRENPEAVHSLFSKEGEGSRQGIIRRLEDTIERAATAIENKAGKTTSVDNTFVLGRQLKNINQRMDAFEDRLTQIENRYWSQFTAMEKAIQRMNSQSNYLMQQFS